MKTLGLIALLLSGITPAESGSGTNQISRIVPPQNFTYVPPRLSIARNAYGGVIVSMPRQPTNEVWIFEATLELGTNAAWFGMQNMSTDGVTLWTETAGGTSFWRARRIN